MKEGATTTWYLILGSGPTDLDGTSDQNGRLAVIPLDDRLGNPASLKSMRVPAAVPEAVNEFGTIYIPDSQSFISDLITVDMETLPDYKADVVYFGTVSGDWRPGDWGGKLYRLVTRSDGSTSVFGDGSAQVETKPSEWPGLLSSNPNVLFDAGEPIVTAPTVGTDGRDFWVYFGTGRFFDAADKLDDGSNEPQYFFGIREPIDCSGASFGGNSWVSVWNNRTDPGCTLDPRCGDADFGDYRGTLGLLPVENIAINLVDNVTEDTPGIVGCLSPVLISVPASAGPPPVAAYDTLFDPDIDQCFFDNDIPVPPGGHDLRTGERRSFNDLLNYALGEDVYCSPGTSPGFDGWSKELPYPKERNLGQATLLAGLTTFTTYIPNTNLCSPEGSGYLYGLFYQTGTSWVEDIFGRTPANVNQPIDASMSLGAGLSTTPNIHVGEEEGGKAFIQTSVGQIVEIPQPNLPMKNIKTGRIKWWDIE
jgi:type IV pilus assembly protein PilY1